METAQMSMFERQTPAQRVAFALAVAHAVLPQLAAQPAGQAHAQRALEAAGRWAAGAAVGGDALADFLMDEREEGLLLYDQQCSDESRRLAWFVIETAIAFASWSAAQARGEHPAALVSEVDDDTPALLIDQALQAGVDAAALAALRKHVQALPAAATAEVAPLVARLAAG